MGGGGEGEGGDGGNGVEGRLGGLLIENLSPYNEELRRALFRYASPSHLDPKQSLWLDQKDQGRHGLLPGHVLVDHHRKVLET